MTHIAELRKDPRPTDNTPEARPSRIRLLPSTHISPYLLKLLGLTKATGNTTA